MEFTKCELYFTARDCVGIFEPQFKYTCTHACYVCSGGVNV